ncbi:MAG TPA: Ada metal-binding domain-containing protein [Caldimonas sp.]
MHRVCSDRAGSAVFGRGGPDPTRQGCLDEPPSGLILPSRGARVLAHDRSADGTFWYSVETTGVYCQRPLPTCSQRRQRIDRGACPDPFLLRVRGRVHPDISPEKESGPEGPPQRAAASEPTACGDAARPSRSPQARPSSMHRSLAPAP